MLDSPNLRYKASRIFAAPRGPIHTSCHVLDAPTLPHDHDFFEIAFIAGGAGIHVSARGEQSAARGDGWILAPGAWHAYRDCRDLEVRNCCFGGALLERDLAALRHDAGANHLFFNGPLALERRGIIAFHLESGAAQGFLESWDVLHGAATELGRVARLLLFLEGLSRHFDTSHRQASEKKQHFAAVAAMKLLENEPQRAWTLELLARQLHLAPGYLARVFKSATGLAPIVWLHRLRAERAAQLLLQTELPIAQIGARVGWDDPNLFARRFRATYGTSASNYRARFRAGGEAST